MTADLHCHTRLSDGTMGIEDIITLAVKSGIKTISITDHDCLAATVRAQIVAKRFDITVIPGVELSCTDRKRAAKAHLLCYYPDKPERLESLCHKNSSARKIAGKVMAVRTAERYPIATEYIGKCATGSTNIFKQHIMQALVESGYSTTIFGDLYNELFSKESPNNILVNTTYVSPEEALEAIHEAGGIAVLAHPGYFDNFELLSELTALGLDGVEVWHPENSPEQQEYLISFAKSHNLLMTGGTDFHGGYNAYPIRLGDYGPPQECVDELIAYKAKQRRKQKRLEKALANGENK